MGHIFASLLAVVAALYAWGVGGFLFFCFSKNETESRMRTFLEEHRRFYIGGDRIEGPGELTRQAIRSSGLRGWSFTALPIMGLSMDHHGDYWMIASSVGVLFFGGLMFAYSWYGLRCFRLLGIEHLAYTQEAMQRSKTSAEILAQNKKLFAISAIIVALGIFGGYVYISIQSPHLLPSWMIFLDFALYAIFLYVLWRRLLKK